MHITNITLYEQHYNVGPTVLTRFQLHHQQQKHKNKAKFCRVEQHSCLKVTLYPTYLVISQTAQFSSF